MKFTLSLSSLLAATALAVGISLPAMAESAILSGSQPGSRINVRSQPTVDSYSPHYGLVGDRIQIIKDARGYDGYTWYYVRFPSGAEGWIRGDFVTVPVTYPGRPGYPTRPGYPNHGRETTVASFETSNYSVNVFRRRGRLFMNVYNRRSGIQELNWAPAEAVTSARGTSYYSGTRNYGYTVFQTARGRYVLEVRLHGRLVAREGGAYIW
ncbi:SH3 domain-containing protein [Leptothermofonsia sichuanensis]|uniref:SH3 domain-containing protein n=1 Tax=Leptothermofonsia sichuanensis TaxID=2917832 RepID=UPI001CA743FE|nr:SH3 domain-containing protein [Leptothermofonsia sichuanensis]